MRGRERAFRYKSRTESMPSVFDRTVETEAARIVLDRRMVVRAERISWNTYDMCSQLDN